MKTALITGITGQDGSYLAEFLIEKRYKVYGIVRRSSVINRQRIEELYYKKYNYDMENLEIIYGDLGDSSSLNRILKKSEPDEVYNLAAQSHVGVSFRIPEYTGDITGLGVIRMLDGLKDLGIETRFYQASSSEMFGDASNEKQSEKTPFSPRSPYACSKVFGFHITRVYRKAYNMFASNGILFNHESPRRGENFVTRKITLSLARIKVGLQDKLFLGNLDAKRDWGYAKDFVESMWLILQHHKPDDFVISTGETHTVREFAEEAAKLLGFDIKWQGHGIDEHGIDSNTGKSIIEVSPQFYRPLDVDFLLGDPSKAKKELNWTPKVTFNKLIKIMVESDLELATKIKTQRDQGIFI
ncbi:MAG: GDP-mannose 4,6-dehydratase [Promethearchaeota archaeon]